MEGFACYPDGSHFISRIELVRRDDLGQLRRYPGWKHDNQRLYEPSWCQESLERT